DRVAQAQQLVEQVQARWSWLLSHLDTPLREAREALGAIGLDKLVPVLDERLARQPDATVFHLLQDRTIRISWKIEVRAPLRQVFNGGAFRQILEECAAIHKRVLRGRVFVSLHMHAGDGNVHTNIPVNSDHYQMLQDAHAAVER